MSESDYVQIRVYGKPGRELLKIKKASIVNISLDKIGGFAVEAGLNKTRKTFPPKRKK